MEELRPILQSKGQRDGGDQADDAERQPTPLRAIDLQANIVR